ncbi:hypothetical protein SAMN06296378_2825 [Salinibacterium xinjiangense]|uniref:Uncharacterized protein n=1 Tax=Salinibacterium xinjiangense TaxID=386302 RepID=A0A2C9A2X5_9MICO|nr:hypothetical protein SAMN06296378_2825 [Salinibacterium xinjiangense]
MQPVSRTFCGMTHRLFSANSANVLIGAVPLARSTLAGGVAPR